MADNACAAEEPSSSDQKMFECPVCLRRFDPSDRVPKTLDCGHSFCVECLISRQEASRITCSVCDRESIVPDEKVENFQTDQTILQLLGALCEECKGGPGDHFCDHCDQNLCIACRQAHARSILAESLRSLQATIDSIDMDQINTRVEEDIRRANQNADDALAHIRSTFDERRRRLREDEARLIAEFKGTAEIDPATSLF